MYYSHVGGSHLQCVDHINLNAMNIPCSPHYRGLRSSLRSCSSLNSRSGSWPTSGAGVLPMRAGSYGGPDSDGVGVDGLPVQSSPLTAKLQRKGGSGDSSQGGSPVRSGVALTITPLAGGRPAGRQMASRRQQLTVVRSLSLLDGDAPKSDSDAADRTELPPLPRSPDSDEGSESSPPPPRRSSSRDFFTSGGGDGGGGSLMCFGIGTGTRSFNGRSDMLGKIYLASANVERKGEASFQQCFV